MYDLEYETTKKTSGKNTCEIIVLHHTGGGTFSGNMEYLAHNESAQASAHYVIGENGEIGKIGNDTDILWHAGVSTRGDKTNINPYSIGIEIVNNGENFTDLQRNSVDKLVIELIKTHNITKENLVRHKDIAPLRKVDPYDTLWNNRFETYEQYVNYLFNKTELMGAYETMFKDENKYNNKSSVFNDVDGAVEKCINSDGSINGKEFFYLCMIGFERINKK